MLKLLNLKVKVLESIKLVDHLKSLIPKTVYKEIVEWSEKIEEDFTRYLQQQDIPHYVNDFVRRNKKHIDELHLPRF